MSVALRNGSLSFVRSTLSRRTHHSHRHLTSLSSSSSSSSAPGTGRTVSRLPDVPDNCHRFILMRHGQSSFNDAAIFTGWCDVALTRRGVVEALEAGEVFRSHNLQFRKCYTSLLTRSIVTAHRCLEAAGVAFTPLELDWRFNERHYGALQGLSKEQTAVRLGRELVMEWRRSYDARPPLMTDDHPHFQTINADPRYRHLIQQPITTSSKGESNYNSKDDSSRSELSSLMSAPSSSSSASSGILPRGESLADCQVRVVEAWKGAIKEINTGFDNERDFDYSLLVAHANTLRALVMHLDDIPVDDIEGLNIPTAIPFYYDVHKSTGQVVMSSDDNESSGIFRGTFITDERKQQSFLERRRAANDPWLWALHSDQVAPSMLNATSTVETGDNDDLMVAFEEEARKNTNLFEPGLSQTDATTQNL